MTREKSNVSVVRQIDLGSLSSKMCRVREHGENRKIPDMDGRNSELSSSQKENLCDGLEDNEACSITADLTPQVSHSEKNCTSITNPQCLANEHIMEVNKSEEVTIHPVFSPSSKRKAELTMTSMDKMSVSSKKAKLEGISIESDMMFSSQEQTEISDTSNQPREPSTASCLWNKPQKVYEKVDKSLDGAETSKHSAVEPSKASENIKSSRLPYYLRNFRTVLEAVLENEDDRELFNQEDLSSIHAFEKLSGYLKSNVFYNLFSVSFTLVSLMPIFFQKSRDRSCT